MNRGVLQMTSLTEKSNELLGRRLDAVNELLKNPNLNKWAVDYWSLVHARLLRKFHDTEHVPYMERESIIYAHTPPFDKVK